MTTKIQYKLVVTEKHHEPYIRGGLVDTQEAAQRNYQGAEYCRDKRTKKPAYEIVKVTTHEEVVELL
jgi:hypothetical protein